MKHIAILVLLTLVGLPALATSTDHAFACSCLMPDAETFEAIFVGRVLDADIEGAEGRVAEIEVLIVYKGKPYAVRYGRWDYNDGTTCGVRNFRTGGTYLFLLDYDEPHFGIYFCRFFRVSQAPESINLGDGEAPDPSLIAERPQAPTSIWLLVGIGGGVAAVGVVVLGIFYARRRAANR